MAKHRIFKLARSPLASAVALALVVSSIGVRAYAAASMPGQALPSLSGGLSNLGVGSVIGGGAYSSQPLASEQSLQSMGNQMGSDIQQAAQVINAAQLQQSQIETKLTDAANAARAQTNMQVADGQVQAQLALAQPTDGNGTNLRLANNCGMSQGALGVAAGQGAALTSAGSISGALRNYNANTANVSQQQIVKALASTPPKDLVSNDMIGDPGGSGTPDSSYSPQAVNRYIQIVTNPAPLPNLSATEAKTQSGKRYEALQNLQRAILDIPQQTMNGVAQMNAPGLPMKTWVQAELVKMKAPTSLVSAFSATAKAQLPPPTITAELLSGAAEVAAGMVCAFGASFGNTQGCVAAMNAASDLDGSNNISLQNFLYTMVQARVANPAWWTSLEKMNSAPPLLQEIAEIDALRAQMDYENMVNISRMADMEAEQMAQQENSKIIPQAKSLRAAAISEVGQQ